MIGKLQINGKEIEKLITKYYYKGEKLYFSIILRIAGVKEEVVYCDYDNYSKYRSAFHQLMSAKNENSKLSIPSI